MSINSEIKELLQGIGSGAYKLDPYEHCRSCLDEAIAIRDKVIALLDTPASEQPDDCRAAFEKDHTKVMGIGFTQIEDGEYTSAETAHKYAWFRYGWNARYPARELITLDPEMPPQEILLHMGEMTAQEIRTARAAIRWANYVAKDGWVTT